MSDSPLPASTTPSGATATDAAPLVAFDFDGTLTRADSYTALLRWRAAQGRGPGWTAGLLRLAPAALRYLLDRDRGRLKAAAARVFLRGLSRAELAQEASAFAAARSRDLLRPDALAAWADWRARGATLVIVTASPEDTVAPFARALEADLLLGTRLEFDADDRVTGALAGPNCRGAEKVARLRAALGPDMRLQAAYGDTAGDREMLAAAVERGFRVFTGRS